MYSPNAVPIVGRDFAFKAALAVQEQEGVKNIDFRNALRFLDVLTRQGRLLNEGEREAVVHQIAAHLCRCGLYRPLVVFAQYNRALTQVVWSIACTQDDVLKAADVIRHLFSVLAKAKSQGVCLYDTGDISDVSLFVRREFQRGSKWTGLYGYGGAAVIRLAHGKPPSTYY